MAILGAGAPLELPIDLFRVLMAFVETSTTRQAFETLDVDIDLERFAGIVTDFVDRGLLRYVQAANDDQSLRQLLNPGIFSDPVLVNKISDQMRQGRAIVIPDALPLELADQVHRDLDRSTSWTLVEGAHDFFHHRNCIIEVLEKESAALMQCSRLFKSTATRKFIGELSGEDCTAAPGVSAAWYRPGEYALPHNDSEAPAPRSVAYIWYLTKDWRREWGGALFWCPTGQFVSPGFNVLLMFRVIPSNVHLICPVAPSATGKRLTINGFWHRAERQPSSLPCSADAVVSCRAYGQICPNDSGLLPAIVL